MSLASMLVMETLYIIVTVKEPLHVVGGAMDTI